MRFNNNKLGYTLAEVMIVLLILSIIFAAFAPLITKRRASTDRSKYAVWNWVDVTDAITGPRDAYFATGDKNHRGSALFGLDAQSSEEVTDLAPNSRVIIRSSNRMNNSDVQRQIQFRFGKNGLDDSGKPNNSNAGTWLMDGKNILLGGSYPNMKATTKLMDSARNNVALGYDAANIIASGVSDSSISRATDNVAIGYNAGKAITDNYSDNVYVGSHAGEFSHSTGQTFVGANAGQNNQGQYNTAIGYNAGNGSANGKYNTFIGANSGESITTGTYNFGMGYQALQKLTTGEYNTAVGAGALKNLTTGSYNVAIGYNACEKLTTESYITCIGANSGPKQDSQYFKFLKNGGDTTAERTYIGSKPKEGFGGDAVLEIHNIKGEKAINATLLNDPGVRSNTTTVINGNLIVRGNLFFTSGSQLWRLANMNVSSSGLNNGLGVDDSNFTSYRCASEQRSYLWTNNCPNLKNTTSTSDRRLKNIGKRNYDGLDKINLLKVYNYNFKKDKNKTPQVGVMAQYLEKIFPNSVYEGEDGYLKIRWDEMFFASINAILQIDKKVVKLVHSAANIEKKIAKLEKQNAELRLQVAELTQKVEALKK